MNLAVVILNWNGRALLEKFLPSVINNSDGHDIYVIDNASTDDSVQWLNENFEAVKIIELDENLGYAGGYNEGLKQVNAEILCLLNNDVEVTDSWTRPIMNSFSQNPELAVIQPKILDYKNRSKFEYAGACGGFIDRYGFPYCRGRIFETLEHDVGQYDDEMEILWASGACLFIRKSAFDSCKGFDSSFFAHMEEVDLCWRLRNMDLKIKCIPDSTVYHLGGGTLNQGSARKTFLNFKNSLFMLYKNLPRKILLPVILLRLFLDGIAAVKFFLEARGNHSLSVLKAHWSFYSNLGRLKTSRGKQNQRSEYYEKRSIVWSYFIKGIKEYSRL